MKAILEQPDSEQLDSVFHVAYVAMPPENRVEAFLATHPQVEQYLLDARAPLQHAFEKHMDTVSVIATTNPEMMEGEFLVCRIQTSLPAAQALARLNAFDDAWNLANNPRTEGRVVFNVTFPRA
jgi:hypothetical protein